MIDTHAKITPENFASLSLAMIINLMKAEKFEGANTDALDFPFAIMKYDPKLNVLERTRRIPRESCAPMEPALGRRPISKIRRFVFTQYV